MTILNLKDLKAKLVRLFKKRKKNTTDEKVLKDLYERLSNIEKKQQQLEQMLTDKSRCIDKIIIEQMYTDKIEFNLDAIDVKELSGMLSIGLNYEGKLQDKHKPKINMIFD